MQRTDNSVAFHKGYKYKVINVKERREVFETWDKEKIAPYFHSADYSITAVKVDRRLPR